MPLHLKVENDICMPVIICDHCLREITRWDYGNYQHKVNEEDWENTDGVIYFTHKSCSNEFESSRGGHGKWMSMGLECLPVYLVTNLQIDWDQAKENAASMGQM